MSTLLQALLTAAGLALLMSAWAWVQQRWLAQFAPDAVDALAARDGDSGSPCGRHNPCGSCPTPCGEGQSSHSEGDSQHAPR